MTRDVTPISKECSDCREVKPLEMFNRDGSRADGRAYRCRDCLNARTRAVYALRVADEGRTFGKSRRAHAPLGYRGDGRCAMESCDERAKSIGLCASHYQRFHKHGDFNLTKPTVDEAFRARVDKSRAGGCWLWTGPFFQPHGYGQFRHRGAHRYSYETLVGPVPAGLEIDHLCHVRHCVNPSHLEAVTHAENMRRRRPQ